MAQGLDPLPLACLAKPSLAIASEGAVVVAEVDHLGAGVLGDGNRLFDGIAATNEQASTAIAQRSVEVAQRIDQKREPVRCGEARGEDRVVEDEQRNDLLAARSRGERGIVVDAQVPVEEEDRCLHTREASGTTAPALLAVVANRERDVAGQRGHHGARSGTSQGGPCASQAAALDGLTAQLRGAQLQHSDQLDRGTKGVGDRGAVVERQRGVDLTVDLGEKND